jgi:sulfatase modifying factor 1
MRRFEFTSWRSTRSRVLSVAAGALAAVAGMAAPSFAGMVTFGSGANTFNMEFKTIGNPGNAADTTGDPNPAGRVDYEYGIGKFEVSRDMITKYNAAFGTANNLAITLQDMTIYGGNGADKPATGISWNEAARFVNWLNESQGFAKAYKFAAGSAVNANIQTWTSGEAGYLANNRYRNSLAKYVLPSMNEWYKAAYFSPGGTYYNYATGSDTIPTAVTSGTGSGTAVYGFVNEQAVQGPAVVDQAGGLSPYGVMGLEGNVREWQEGTSFGTGNNSNASGVRYYRGGAFDQTLASMGSGDVSSMSPTIEHYAQGFRVVTMVDPVPEPSMMVIGTLFGLGGLVAKRRRKK